MIKTSLLAATLIVSTFQASAAEIKEVSISGITDVSVVSIAKGCTKTTKGAFGIKNKKTVDCFAVFLKGVTGTNQLGNVETVGDVLLYPAGEDRRDADTISNLLIAKLKGNIAEGATVDFSNLRFVAQDIALGDLIKEPSNRQPVKLGGISAHVVVVTQDGNFTRTESNNVSVGLQ